ncbi:TPA: hypothetical protein ACFK2Q_10030 [Neisseria gonorrhoeae]
MASGEGLKTKNFLSKYKNHSIRNNRQLPRHSRKNRNLKSRHSRADGNPDPQRGRNLSEITETGRT